MLGATIFGAVHCIAWPYSFPSHAEQLLWRMSAIAIVAIPVAMLIGAVVRINRRHWIRRLSSVATIIGGIMYVSARLLLLVLSFTTLRSLPFTAYQTVEWTAFIPHI